MGELCLTDAKILCRLLLGDAALLAQQRDNAIEFDPHDPYILFRGSAGIAAGPQWCPCRIFYTLYIITGGKHFVNQNFRQILCCVGCQNAELRVFSYI